MSGCAQDHSGIMIEWLVRAVTGLRALTVCGPAGCQVEMSGGVVTGGPGALDITTLRLPGVGWILQWRGDSFWRELSDLQYQDEVTGVHIAGEEEWVRWSGLPQPHARGGAWDGISAWWLVYGELPANTVPTVDLTDGTRPPVLVLGRVWACEWQARAQPVTVRVEGEKFDLPFLEPFYRRSPKPVDGPGWPGVEPRGWFRE